MIKLFWTLLVLYHIACRDFIECKDVVADSDSDKCVVSLIIPKDSIKTSCDNNDEYHRTQKLRSIESQLNTLRRQVNDLNVKFTFTVSKSNTGHKDTNTEARFDKLESTIPELQKLVQNLEEEVSNKITTDRSGNIDRTGQEEPYSRKKLARIVKSLLRKEKLEFISVIKEEFLNEIGEQVKNEILSSIMRDGKLIHEINTQILLNNVGNDNYDMTESRKEVRHRENVYDTSQSAINNEFPEQILSRSYRSDESYINHGINRIRNEILQYQDKQTDKVNSYLAQVESKLNELNAAKHSNEGKHDKRIKRLQSDTEDTKQKIVEIEQDVETLVGGIKSLQENMDGNQEMLQDDLKSTERKILMKITKSNSTSRSSEVEYLKNQTMAVDKYLKMTESKLRNMIADIRLKHHHMEQNMTLMTKSIEALNNTLDPSYDGSFNYGETMHELDILDTIAFVKDIRDSWPAVIGNITDMEIIHEIETKSLQDKLEDIAYKFENVSKTHKNLNEKTEEVKTEIHYLEEKVRTMENAMRQRALENNEWSPYNFNHTFDCSGCNGGQKFVKKTGYNVGAYVGVVLCSSTRYKIYLSDSLHETFLNIGDTRGFGKDHCEFVGAERNASMTVNGDYPLERTQGFKRADWGQIPVKGLLSFFFSTPLWYECGVSIPW